MLTVLLSQISFNKTGELCGVYINCANSLRIIQFNSDFPVVSIMKSIFLVISLSSLLLIELTFSSEEIVKKAGSIKEKSTEDIGSVPLSLYFTQEMIKLRTVSRTLREKIKL